MFGSLDHVELLHTHCRNRARWQNLCNECMFVLQDDINSVKK